MTTGFFQFFNSKAQRAQKRANAEQKSRSRRDRSPLKPRRLLTEALEERQLLAVDVLGMSSALLPTEATANVVNITSSDYSIDALKEAIKVAAASPEDDVIRIASGTLQFSSASDSIEIDINAAAYGSLTIVGMGDGVTFDAKDLARVFVIKNGDVSLEGITVKNGKADYGGAIANAGDLTLTNVTLTGNEATSAGGAIANKGALAIQSSIIVDNQAAGDGAAIYSGDFDWPSVVEPEWTADIDDVVGGTGSTRTINLPDYCSAGDWTYSFTCSNPNSSIFAAEPTLVNGVLTLRFIGQEDYTPATAERDFSSVDFTVTASDGTTAVSQSFNVAHEHQTSTTVAAILSNMDYDALKAAYAITHKVGKKDVLDGFEAEVIPSSEIVDLTNEDLYVQVWTSDFDYNDGEGSYAYVWDAGEYIVTGYDFILTLTNATITQTFPNTDLARSAYGCEDLGGGRYHIAVAYTEGLPFGLYEDAGLLDYVKIAPVDASKPVSAEIAQYTTDFTRPSFIRLYDSTITSDGRTYAKVNPTQILYVSSISNSTEPLSEIPGNTFTTHYSSVLADSGTGLSTYSVTVSNSLIANNTASGNGVIYVVNGGVLNAYNTTVANNSSSGAAVYALGTATVANSIVVNGSLAPVSSGIGGSNNLVNATWSGSATYDSGLPLFKNAANGDYTLAVGSQAANSGAVDYALDIAGETLVTDLAGAPRFSATVDAGAYEYQGTAPSAPTNLVVSDYVESSKNPTLTWNAPSSVDGIDGYYVYVGASTTPIAVVTDATSLANLASLVTFEDNSSYQFGVAAYNVYGKSDTTLVTLDTTVAPVAPTNLAFGVYAGNSATLTWTGVSNATSYRIALTNVDAGTTETFVTNDAAYTFMGLADYANYSCTVTAVNTRGEATSAAVTLNTTVTPAIPTGLTATSYVGDGTETVSWNAVDHAEGYLIAVNVDGNWQVVGSTATTSYQFTGLTDNTSYTFGVASYATKDGEQLASDFASIAVVTTVAPDAPTGLEWISEYASNAATLQWVASEGAVGYTVALYQDGGWNVLGSTTGLQYQVTGLADNQEYVVGVAAYSLLDGVRLYSDYSSIELNTVVAPATPSNVHFLDYSGGTIATLTWTASVGGATGYVVEQEVDGTWTQVALVTGTDYTATVEENSFYTYRVIAYTTVGSETRYSTPSLSASIDTLVPPTGVIEVKADGYDYTTGAATLTWTNLAHASYYTVAQKAEGESTYSIIASNVPAGSEAAVSYGLSGLAAHTTYQYRVTACNSKGEGSVGYSDEFYTEAPPAAPTATYVYFVQSASAILSYNAEYATSYIVKDADGNVLYEGSDESYTVTGLQENETYLFTIAGVNAAGVSEETTLTVHTAAVPQAPTGLAFGEYANHSVTVTWNDVEAETKYTLYRLQDGDWVKIADYAANVTEAQLTGLADYSTYTVCVTASNEVGESARSASATLNTAVAPAAPTNLTFTFGEAASYQGDGKATFAWDAVEHAAGYDIEQKIDGIWTVIASTADTSYDLSGLDNYNVYEFGVAAYSLRDTERLYSEFATAELSTNWVPTAPIEVAVGDYDSSAKTAVLSWDSVAEATSYRVDQYVDGAWKSVGTTTANEYTLTALIDNTNYVFRVVARNEIGDGSSGSVELFTAAAPAAPTAAYEYDSESLSVTFSYSSDFATSYTITDEEGEVLYQGADKSFTVTGLEENVTYKFEIVASNELGSSPATTLTVYTAAVPAAPTNLVLGDYADHSVTLYWDSVDAADGYRLYVMTDSGWMQFGPDLDASSNYVVINDLEDFDSYLVCVAAFNNEGESAKSQSVIIDTTLAPAAPENVGFEFGPSESYQGDGVATLVWDSVEHAEAYVVQQKVDGEWATVATVTETSLNLTGLENFQIYEYQVAAVAYRGSEGLYSDFVAAQLNTAWIPEGDITVVASEYDYDANTATLTWNSVDHADDYRVDQLVSGEWISVAVVPDTEYVLSLSDNTEYTFRVVAKNEVGDGSSDSVTFFTFAPPAAPIDAAFGEYVPETGKATMTWSAVAYAEWYEVRYQVEGEWVVIQRDVTNFTAEGLEQDTEYVYEVRACNFIGTTSVEGYSDWVTVVLDTHPEIAPNAPSDLAVVGYDEATSSATLTWTDNSRNEDRFVIQRSFDGETWTDLAYLAANVTSCNITALQRGVTYKYRICAENQYGASDWVEVEYTVPTGVPAAPSNVTFSEYDEETRSFVMSWNDNSTNELYFKIEYSLDGADWSGSYTVGANETTLTLSNLIEGKVYHFRVSAWNSFGVSDYAYGEYEVPVDGKTRPAAPSDIVFGAYDYSTNTVQMSWTDNADNEDGFIVEFSFDGETWRTGGKTAANVTTRTATGMFAGRTYYFRVAATNVAGQSAWAYSDQFIAQTTLPTPENFVVHEDTYSEGTVLTSWTYGKELDAEDGGFVVQYSVDGSTWKHASYTGYNVTERTAWKMEPGRTYYFRVAAFEGAVYSDWLYSSPYTAPSNVPTAPSDLTVDFHNDTAVLEWIDHSELEVGFNVQYSIDNGETWISAGNTAKDITTKTITSLRWGGEYQFRVRAYNYHGASDWIVASATSEHSENVPNAPTDVTFGAYNALAKTLEMSWTDNSNNESGFTVQYSYDGGKTWYFAGGYGENVTTRLATGLVSGRTYQFRVCSYNADGASDWAYSEEFAATASDQIPAAPTGLTATLNADAKTVALQWTDNSSNEAGFKVEASVDGSAWAERASVAANETSCLISDLVAGHAYTFRVSAYSDAGTSAVSNEAAVAVPSDTGIAAPVIEDYTYSSTRRRLTLTWAAVDAAASYEVQYQVDGSVWIGLTASETSATLSGATYGKTYSFRVRAVSNDGDVSDWTEGWYNTATNETSLSSALLDAAEEAEIGDSIDLISSGLLAADEVDSFFQDFFEEEF